MVAVEREQDPRLDILNTLLTTPHRELDQIWPVHEQLSKRDPRFYVRLAAWYADKGDVRDHSDMFIVSLLMSRFTGHRDVGLAMLRKLPPYRLVRVVDFISGRKTTRKLTKRERETAEKAKTRKGRRSLAKRLFGAKENAPATIEIPKVTVEATGLFRSVPRSVKTEVTRYLREREADPQWFDSSVLIARKAMKRLYALLHIRPDERAQQILFDENPPPGSKLFALRQLAAAENPAAQAQAIVDHKIPYRVASTVVRQMTPSVLAALVNQMSAQELINNVGSLKRRGAMDHAEIKQLIDEKLAKAATAKNVSALKATKAAEAAGVSDDVRKSLDEVADRQIKAKGRITRPTALLIDKSMSMELSIELGKRIGSILSTVCESDLYVYAFDSIAYPIEPAGEDLADWARAMEGIGATGCTSCGSPIAALTHNRQRVEQIIMITDEGHNTPPAPLKALEQYRDAMNVEPNVCIVRTPGGCDAIEKMLQRNGWVCDVFPFAGDYYALPNMIPMLAKPSKMDLLTEIINYPLPKRVA